MDLGKEHTHQEASYKTGDSSCMGCHNDMGTHSAAHPGFKAVEEKIAHEPGIHDAGAVLGAAAQKASAAAKAANPRLKRVHGA